MSSYTPSRLMFKPQGPKLTFPESDDVILLEYIATDRTRLNIVTKTHIMHTEPKDAKDCPVRYMQQYDTVAGTDCPELALVPLTLYRDPFRQGKHKLVYCQYESVTDKPIEYNTRNKCKELLDSVAHEEPWFGFEQEYYFIDENGIPLDYDWKLKNRDIDCSQEMDMGTHVGFERDIAEVHLRACIYVGLNMYGMTREINPSQWEYQMGPTLGITAADELHVSRYILRRIAEMYGVGVTFWNPDCLRWADSRSNLHLNFSTKRTREENGIEQIYKIVGRLEKYPQDKLLKHYDLKDGKDAPWRLSGQTFMPSIDQFVCGVGDKNLSSVRIPSGVYRDKKGYIEERRISGESDPYDVISAFVTAALFDTNGL